jgi:heme-degrading monooxygenase HmoA
MQALILQTQVDPKKIDEVAAIYSRITPTLQTVKGWQGLYVLAERRAGQVRILTLWESDEDARAFAASDAWKEMAAEFRGMVTEQPRRALLEVIYHT